MLETSLAYRAAVVGQVRRTRVRVPLRIAPTGMRAWCSGVGSTSALSQESQLCNGVTEAGPRYATLERGRWLLNGSVSILPDTLVPGGEAGYVSGAVSRADGTYAFGTYISPRAVVSTENASAIHAVTVHFSKDPADGVAEDFTVSVYSSDSLQAARTVTGNRDRTVWLYGFSVYNPTEIRILVTKWSLPGRRARVIELSPGYIRDWTEDDVASLSIKMQASASAMTMPYGAASLTFDNGDRLFDPRNPEGLFSALEERQAVPIQLGVDTENGTEYLPCGVWYQHDRGWSTGDGGLTMRWDLVDIVGLLSDASFRAPATLPTTLSGWAEALVSQLGDSFASHYTVDPDYQDLTLTVQDAADVEGKRCGDILRWLCQAAGVFARADAETGYLALEPFWSQGNEYTLDNLERVPTISANEALGFIQFRLPEEELLVSGNTSASAVSVTVDNPFITTQAQALSAARHILSAYGGTVVSTVGRGDMSSEVGDVATVDLGGVAAAGRVTSQTLEYSGGVLRSCRSELLQADGGSLYENRVVLTEDGTWTAPAGVTKLSLILVGGGQAGGKGTWGTTRPSNLFSIHAGYVRGDPGNPGEDGSGGKVWYGTILINEGQSFAVTIGQGGTPSEEAGAAPTDGAATTFGSQSSANGRTYDPSFTDIASGSVFGRSGVAVPPEFSGDGGAGGSAGSAGASYWYQEGSGYALSQPSTDPYYKDHPAIRGSEPGTGAPGASGCVVIYYDKEADT